MPIPSKLPTPPVSQQSTRRVSFESVKPVSANRIVIYGTGGIGKTTLALKLPGRTAFIDADASLGKLEDASAGLTRAVARVPVSSWQDARNALSASGWDGIDNIVVDTATELQKLLTKHVIENVPKEKGGKATGILDYGFGKGYRHLFDHFLYLLSDLDAHYRAGRTVVLVCHETPSKVPNPAGEEYIRWEPDLLKTANESIRDRVKSWADYVLFLSYDIAVKDGKAAGCGTRTLYTDELPYFMAKSRGYHGSIAIPDNEFNPWPVLCCK